MMMEAMSAFAVLLFVLGIMLAIAWGIRKVGLLPGQPLLKGTEKQIEVLESRMLDGRNRLIVVQWKNKQYLLATNPNTVRVVSDAELSFKELVEDNDQK